MAEAVLGVLLLSGTYARAHFAFSLAAGAAALGRSVVLFASAEGCAGLLQNGREFDIGSGDATMRAAGVAGLGELREAARELGVKLLACEAALRASRLETEELCAGAEVSGIASFLEAVGSGQIVTV